MGFGSVGCDEGLMVVGGGGGGGELSDMWGGKRFFFSF